MHVAPVQAPLVVSRQQHGAHQAGDDRVVGEDAHDCCPPRPPRRHKHGHKMQRHGGPCTRNPRRGLRPAQLGHGGQAGHHRQHGQCGESWPDSAASAGWPPVAQGAVKQCATAAWPQHGRCRKQQHQQQRQPERQRSRQGRCGQPVPRLAGQQRSDQRSGKGWAAGRMDDGPRRQGGAAQLPHRVRGGHQQKTTGQCRSGPVREADGRCRGKAS